MGAIKHLKKTFLSLILVIPLVLSSCSSSNTEKVRVVEVMRSIFYAPQYVAIEKGFFQEEGIDLELTTAWGGDKAITTIVSDYADIGLVGSETTMYVQGRGARDPVVNFAKLTNTDGTFLVSKQPIENFEWSLLKGRDMLGQRQGGMPRMAGDYVLKKNEINPETDINLIDNIDLANLSQAFVSGTGEFVQLFEPQATILEQEGRGHIVASFGQESGQVPYTACVAKQSKINNDPEMMSRFTQAIYKAQQWVDNHSAEETAKVIAPYFENTSEDIITTVVERYKNQGSFSTNPVLTEDEWNQLKTIIDEAGELPDGIYYEDLVDTSFAKEVMQ